MNVKRVKNLADTMAWKVATLSMDAVATAYDCNYCVNRDGSRTLFADHGIPAPTNMGYKQNAQGRCTLSVSQYEDNSTLTND